MAREHIHFQIGRFPRGDRSVHNLAAVKGDANPFDDKRLYIVYVSVLSSRYGTAILKRGMLDISTFPLLEYGQGGLRFIRRPIQQYGWEGQRHWGNEAQW